jgi:hypothetical protein
MPAVGRAAISVRKILVDDYFFANSPRILKGKENGWLTIKT